MAQINSNSIPASIRALRLSEILSKVLAELHEDYLLNKDRTIFACTLVSSRWALEANCYIWKACQGRRSYPTLRALLAVNPERRQRYADNIRYMHVDDNADRVHEGRTTTALASLTFPRLQNISLMPTSYSLTVPEQKFHLLQYLQPNLAEVNVGCSPKLVRAIITNEFLINVVRHCKGLIHFRVVHTGPLVHADGDYVDTDVSPEALASFFKNMTSLQRLILGTGQGIPFSEAAFDNLSLLTSLRSLEIPEIQDSWIFGLDRSSPHSKRFATLERLECRLSPNGISELLPLLPALQRLMLVVQQDTSEAIDAIIRARLPHLVAFGLTTDGEATLQSRDVLRLADAYKCLKVLRLPTNRSSCGESDLDWQGLDDEVVERLAISLPALERLQLFTSRSSLTEDALINLCTHCDTLESCDITAAVDYLGLVKNYHTTSKPYIDL